MQAAEVPKYDSIFVNLGVFHNGFAFFSFIGNHIAEPGALCILTDCNIIEQGPLKRHNHEQKL